MTISDARRSERAIAAIDAVNAEDPNRIDVAGRDQAKELVHSELATAWVVAAIAIATVVLLGLLPAQLLDFLRTIL